MVHWLHHSPSSMQLPSSLNMISQIWPQAFFIWHRNLPMHPFGSPESPFEVPFLHFAQPRGCRVSSPPSHRLRGKYLKSNASPPRSICPFYKGLLRYYHNFQKAIPAVSRKAGEPTYHPFTAWVVLLSFVRIFVNTRSYQLIHCCSSRCLIIWLAEKSFSVLLQNQIRKGIKHLS